jgi:cell division septum initiation protein DivIVA
MAPRLKVFVTSDGLTDYVVATTSKAKALAAWGSHQDLFKGGAARETDDAALVKAATAKPGVVLRRPAGTRGELAKLKPAKPPKPAGPSKAALKKVADLEQKLAELDAAQARALARLEKQRAALDREIDGLRTDHAAERARYEAALKAAEQALG